MLFTPRIPTYGHFISYDEKQGVLLGKESKRRFTGDPVRELLPFH